MWWWWCPLDVGGPVPDRRWCCPLFLFPLSLCVCVGSCWPCHGCMVQILKKDGQRARAAEAYELAGDYHEMSGKGESSVRKCKEQRALDFLGPCCAIIVIRYFQQYTIKYFVFEFLYKIL